MKLLCSTLLVLSVSTAGASLPSVSQASGLAAADASVSLRVTATRITIGQKLKLARPIVIELKATAGEADSKWLIADLHKALQRLKQSAKGRLDIYMNEKDDFQLFTRVVFTTAQAGFTDIGLVARHGKRELRLPIARPELCSMNKTKGGTSCVRPEVVVQGAELRFSASPGFTGCYSGQTRKSKEVALKAADGKLQLSALKAQIVKAGKNVCPTGIVGAKLKTSVGTLVAVADVLLANGSKAIMFSVIEK